MREFLRRRMRRAEALLVLPMVVAAVGAGAPAAAQEDPVHWTIAASPTEVQAGDWSELTVRAELEPGWHIYALTQATPPIATRIRLGPEDVVRSRTPKQPEPIRTFDEAFGIETEYFEEAVDFRVPFAVTSEPGERDLTVQVRFQACTNRLCLPPADEYLTVTLVVLPAADGSTGAELLEESPADGGAGAASALPSLSADGPAGAVPEDASSPAGSPLLSSAVDAGPVEGLGAFLLLAMLMGTLALLTPCVFPMIPITVSYFTKRGGAQTMGVKRAQVQDALLYGGGIVLAFTGLGLLLALLYGATGINRFAANPWINLLVASLFVAFALDLLGAWEMRLPWQLVNRLNAQGERGGVTGLLFMGVAFAVTTFTCTVPFVGTLLVAAASGEWLRPVVGMLVFSSMFAVPFVLLALFPALLQSLPRSGSWMGALMVVLGLVELGAALKFLSNADLVWRWGLLHREVVLALWVALALLAALYLLRQIRLPADLQPDGESSIGVGRMLSGGVFLAVALFLATGLLGRSVGEFEAFLPPAVYPGEEARPMTGSFGGAGPESEELAWAASMAPAREKASTTSRPIFIDFTGYTCTNCRWMEANIFTRPDVRQRFEQYVLVRLYTDGRGEEYVRNQAMQKDSFGTVALPLYVVLSPEGETIATFPGLTRDPHEFLRFLDQGFQEETRNIRPQSSF
jgi:thiol:disulfide interchange protein